MFVGVEGFILYAIVRYRRKPGDDTLPEQLHGNTTVEIIWTLIPTVIVFILFGVSMVSLAEVEARSDHPGVVVQVDGFQWNWTFRYEDGPVVQPQGGEPPVLAVPVGEPVRLVLNSLDVNHAFYVPQFLIKRDLIDLGENGRDNELEFTITEAGTYAGQCAEFCGTSHADMKFVVNAMSREDYDAYITALESGETPAPSARWRVHDHDRDQGEQHRLRHRFVRGPGRRRLLHQLREPGRRRAQRRHLRWWRGRSSRASPCPRPAASPTTCPRCPRASIGSSATSTRR